MTFSRLTEKRGWCALAVTGAAFAGTAAVAIAATPLRSSVYQGKATQKFVHPKSNHESFTTGPFARHVRAWKLNTTGTCTLNGSTSTQDFSQAQTDVKGGRVIAIRNGRFSSTFSFPGEGPANTNGTYKVHFYGKFTSPTVAEATVTMDWKSASSGGEGHAVGNLGSCQSIATFKATTLHTVNSGAAAKA